MESCCDYLRIYNKPDIFYPLLHNDPEVSPGTVTSTDVTGALTFRFHSDDSSTEKGWDATILCGPLSVEGFETLHQLEYYPNPVNHILTINAHEMITKFSLYDVRGRLLRESGINLEKFVIDLQPFSAGSYFLKIMDSQNQSKTIKVIKN